MAAPIRILIAEDHLIARVGIETIINTQPDMSVVAEAANGAEAVELHRKHHPDVTLIDMRMPIMDGAQAIATICIERPGARIIALSTYSGDEDIRRTLASGARGYLTKDVPHEELIRAIHTVHLGDTYLSRPVAAALQAGSEFAHLSAREIDVLSRIAKGLANKQIAFELRIANHTVKNHVQSILAKLGATDRTEAATIAIQRGIIHL
jgi:DNA-binding NarL/FixJ family response regulator